MLDGKIFEIVLHKETPYGVVPFGYMEMFKRAKYVVPYRDFLYTFYDENFLQMKNTDMITDKVVPHTWKPESKLKLLNLVRGNILRIVLDDVVIAKLMLVGDE